MADQDFQNDGASVRTRAQQDLEVLRSRISEAESGLLKLKEEERDLQAFLKRLERYEPDLSSAPKELVEPSVPTVKGDVAARALMVSPGQLARPSIVGPTTGYWAGASRLVEATRFASDRAGRLKVTGIGGPSRVLDGVMRPGVARPRTRRRQITDFVYRAIEVLDGSHSTQSLVNLIRHDAALYSFLGTNAPGTLSSYLSRDPRFVFERGENGGWRLATPDEIANADQGGADEERQNQEGAVSE